MITGFSCPGCGIQRAIHALVHGHFAEAVRYNYYLVYSGPYALSFVVVWLMPKNNIRERIRSVIENKYVVDFYLVTFIIWLFVRNYFNL